MVWSRRWLPWTVASRPMGFCSVGPQQKTIKGLKIKMFVGKLVVFFVVYLVICLFFVGRLAGWARFYFQAFSHLSGFFGVWNQYASASARWNDKTQNDKSWWKRTPLGLGPSRKLYEFMCLFWVYICPFGLGRLVQWFEHPGMFFHLRGSFR